MSQKENKAAWDAACLTFDRITNKAFRAAWRRGWADFHKGVARQRCPYKEKTTGYHNGVTFSRSWRNYWFSGWDGAKACRDATALNAS